ncbi:MAG: O-antigen ligase family protein [Candidatus Levybacteria bacterium]|nr:O-antigen ligase family protein [Candidatus Levybacteria bacterium]
MKIIRWVQDNILFLITLFLLAFIPLYPKLPLVDIRNTWVYIRAEDFIVVFVLSIWMILLVRKKISLKTPLTLPILIFWIIGALATIHGVLIIFPMLANVFPNVSLLSFLRRIEYLSVFFIAFSGMRDKRFLSYVIATLAITLLLVVGYGVGQRYLGFPAYLTMNEEFAKGQPIHLSQLSRLPSTFAGHYDLAAYLVLIIPIMVSVALGIKNLFVRLFLAFCALAGFALLFMTVSRSSFFVLFIALGVVLFFQKKKLLVVSLPVIAIAAFFILSFTPALKDRFGNTVKEVDVLVNAKTGETIGHAKTVEPEYFKGKLIVHDYYLNYRNAVANGTAQELPPPAYPGTTATVSGIVDYSVLKRKVTLLDEVNAPTGENLPQGTGYINLSLSPVTHKVGEYFFETKGKSEATKSADVIIVHGSFLIKRAAAYDLSFTTRFQGEWPHAIEAFMRNVFLGSGYGSISLAIDNNYFRMLGEVGILGAIAFFSIFLITGIYIKKALPQVNSPLVKSFVFGYVAGVIGLSLNAVLIDVFEASKVAFVLWLLTGVTLGVLKFYQEKNIDMRKELKKVVTSPYAVVLYICVAAILVYSPMINNFFVGDDFTWFRWISECTRLADNSMQCPSPLSRILGYFTDSNGFFYRPGTKIYFLSMYSLIWLNQVIYHAVSILLHAIVASLVFLLARKILKDFVFAILASFLFLVLSGYSEAIFWISSTGYLFTALFSLLSLLSFIQWEEKRQNIFLIVSISSLALGLLFHELGIVTPALIIAYMWIKKEYISFSVLQKKYYTLLFTPIAIYLLLRFTSGSHWLSGDYSYNLLKLPFNVVGNAIGYFFLALFGPLSMPFYQTTRNFSRSHAEFVFVAVVLLISILSLIYGFRKRIYARLLEVDENERKIVLFGFAFFIIGLLPFLGLGNISSRYGYLSSIGVVFLFIFFIRVLYRYLLTQGREIALLVVVLLLSSFFLLHLIQIEQAHGDWKAAGEKSEQFLAGIDEAYEDYWATEPMKYYFVNTPLRVGDAWVFPVGLSDALWFSSRNPNISVYKASSVKEALDQIAGYKNERVFEFMDNGRVIEHRKKIEIP